MSSDSEKPVEAKPEEKPTTESKPEEKPTTESKPVVKKPEEKPVELPAFEKGISDKIIEKFGDKVEVAFVKEDRVGINVSREDVHDVAEFIRDGLNYDHVESVSGVDYPQDKEIAVVYHIGSYSDPSLAMDYNSHHSLHYNTHISIHHCTNHTAVTSHSLALIVLPHLHLIHSPTYKQHISLHTMQSLVLAPADISERLPFPLISTSVFDPGLPDLGTLNLCL